MLFNSRNKDYKSIYGAATAGSSITFRLLLPSGAGTEAVSARMLIRADGEGETKVFDFKPTDRRPSGDSNSRFFELDYVTEEPGLYWYCFEFKEQNGCTHRIHRGAYATGYIDAPESWWQQTVYRHEYKNSDSWNGSIMYQIYPDRFYCSGVPKENVPLDRKLHPWGFAPTWRPNEKGEVKNSDYAGGDLKGIEEKLPYLQSLGVNLIYLNPIFEAHSDNRYNTADYEKIDPLLGTEDDFVSLCNSAHALGMRVILDGVFSHTGDDSKYFNKYGRYSNLGAYNSKDSEFFDWFKFKNWPDDYTSWWGIPVLPEVIEENENYANYITGPGGIVEKWLRLGADGWRIDVADELPDEFIAKIRERIEAVKPGAIFIGEVWEDASTKEAYGVRRKYLFGHELTSVMNYPFRNAIIDYLANDRAEDFIDRILTITENYPKPVVDRLMNMLGTHDTVRILTRLAGEDCEGKDRDYQESFSLSPEQKSFAIKLSKLAAVIQYTLPGFPSLYYGDEVSMEGCKDPFNRCCFPWDSVESSSMYNFYVSLGEFRNRCKILRDGVFTPISGAQGCIAYAREIGDSHIVIITNRAGADISYSLPEKYRADKVVLSDNTISECGKKLSVSKDGEITIPAYSFVILGNTFYN